MSSRPPTIHIVSSVELMLGWKTRIAAGSGAVAGSKSYTMCGLGNSRLPLM